MSRSAAREVAVQLTFASINSRQDPEELLERYFTEEYQATLAEENGAICVITEEADRDYIFRILRLIDEHRTEIDSSIETYTKGWKLERISRTALAVLRVAVCEILFLEDIPDKVSVNEAVNIAKGYDDPEVVSFVNGILGSIVREKKKDE